MNTKVPLLVLVALAALSVSAYGLKSFKIFKDCDEVRKSGHTEPGQYLLWTPKKKTLKVHCEHGLNASTVLILQRKFGDISFTRSWAEYQVGFGVSSRDYWAGLETIYKLTNFQGYNVLTFYMQDWQGNNHNVRYSYFHVTDYSQGYRLSVSGYSGSVPDDFSYNNGMPFATYDVGDQKNCAKNQKAGWWFNYCTYTLPTGHYYYGGPYTPSGGFCDGIFWQDWNTYKCAYSLKYLSMVLSTS